MYCATPCPLGDSEIINGCCELALEFVPTLVEHLGIVNSRTPFCNPLDFNCLVLTPSVAFQHVRNLAQATVAPHSKLSQGGLDLAFLAANDALDDNRLALEAVDLFQNLPAHIRIREFDIRRSSKSATIRKGVFVLSRPLTGLLTSNS